MNGPVLKTLRSRTRLRMTLTLLCLLACTLQNFIAQTHVHAAASSTAGHAGYLAETQSDVLLPPSAPDDESRHVRRDGGSCPLCQIVLHGGAVLAFAFTLPLPLLTATSVAPPEQAPLGTVVAVSFNWQGRAPPLT